MARRSVTITIATSQIFGEGFTEGCIKTVLLRKSAGGKPCSADRVNAETFNNAHHIEQFEAKVMWRFSEIGDVIYTESLGKKMLSYANLANWDEWQFPLCSRTGDQNFLVTSNKKIQNITSHEKAPTVTVLTVQIGTTPITPGLIIIADPKLKEGDVDILVDGCNPENSAFRVMATNNGWVNPAAKREFLRVLIESDQNSFDKERIIFFMMDTLRSMIMNCSNCAGHTTWFRW